MPRQEPPLERLKALLITRVTPPLAGMPPALGFIFSRRAERYERYLSFRDVPAEEVQRWQAGVRWFVRKLTRVDGRPLLMKSPPHTARIRLLLELFPDARFVHVYREP